MYTEKVIDHFTNPRNVGEIEDANAVGQVGNPACGDIMKMYLKIEDNIVVDAKFKTFGCCAAIATSSVATVLIKGMTVEQALQLKNKQVVEELGGLPPQKLHCSVLAEEAIRKAIADYYIRGGMAEEEANELCGVVETACDSCSANANA